MSEQQSRPTEGDLRRVMDDLIRAIEEDNDPKDHWPNGRWPMVHRIAAQIDRKVASMAIDPTQPTNTRAGPCPIATAVAADVLTRAERGLVKYGVTLAREDLALDDWLQHAYEEALDQAAYLKRAIVLIRATKKAAPGDAA